MDEVERVARSICQGHPDMQVFLGEPIRIWTPCGVAMIPGELGPLWKHYSRLAKAIIEGRVTNASQRK